MADIICAGPHDPGTAPVLGLSTSTVSLDLLCDDCGGAYLYGITDLGSVPGFKPTKVEVETFKKSKAPKPPKLLT